MSKTSWQRRTCEVPSVRDLVNEEPGTECIWETRAVVLCRSCGRPGATAPEDRLPEGVKAIVIHAVDSKSAYRDYCVEAAFVPGTPTHIAFDIEGKVTGEYYPTSSKVDGRN